MTERRSGHLTRLAALSLAAYGLIVLALCLSPFDFQVPELAELTRLARVELIPFTRVCPAHGRLCPVDAALNIVLYLPFGLLAAAAGSRAQPWFPAAAAAALSVVIEVLQVSLPSRFPSTKDVLANVTGAVVGAAVYRLAARRRRRATASSAPAAPARPAP